MKKGPGRSYRKGISLPELMLRFPDDATAERWFEEGRWPDGVRCAHCDHDEVKRSTHPTMPYRCGKCRKHFSVKTNSVMHSSKIGYQKWALAIYIMSTGIKGTSSMRLHRDLGVTQKTAWHMAHRIRKTWEQERSLFEGPVEVDELYVGGLEKYKHASKKKHVGGGTAGKQIVAGMKDRATRRVAAEVVPDTKRRTLHKFATSRAPASARFFTDDASVYRGLPNHERVLHLIGEYVRGDVHTNGIESFWSMVRRGYHGTYHRMSPAHLQRYLDEFAGRHGQRPMDTEDQMRAMARGLVGKRLRYEDLADRTPRARAS
jgi:transposase-like protein